MGNLHRIITGLVVQAGGSKVGGISVTDGTWHDNNCPEGMKSIQKYPEDYDGVVAGARE
jgi:hypothetical protein